jgi:membrane protein DedA with SNARE-associated domain
MDFNFSEFLASVSSGNLSSYQSDTGVFLSVFFLIVAGEMGIPLPFVLSSTLVFLGYQISQNAISIIPLFVTLIAGRQTGCAIMYFSSRRIGEPFIAWLSKYIPAVEHRKNKVTGKLKDKGWRTVAIGRFTPGLLMPTSLIAGMIGLRYAHFAFGTFVSGLAGDGAMIAFGVLAGHSLKPLHITIPLSYIVIWAVSAIVFALVVRFFFRRFNLKT